jgi:tRNA pseudouridine38-40 synthase
VNRFFLEISFKGTHYHGWQLQPNAITVQSVLESSLKILAGTDIRTTGAGRTDTGVHARFFTLHLDSDHPLFMDADIFLYKINSILPHDIAVHRIYAVPPEAHARFSALSRTYEYAICRDKDPFLFEFAWYFSRNLDLNAMNKAASRLKDVRDFTSFSKLHTDVKTNDCQILEAGWSQHEKKLIFMVKADRFLRNMVRSMVGTLVDVGLGKTDMDKFMDIIEGKNRSLAGFSAPAHGLSLVNICYPDSIRSEIDQKI